MMKICSTWPTGSSTLASNASGRLPGPILLAGLMLLISGPLQAQEDPSSQDERIEEAVRLSEIGRLYYEGGDFERAAEAFAQAWEIHPDQVLGYNAARSFENTGSLDRALEYYQATLALDGDDEAIRQRCRDGITRVQNILDRQAEQRQRQMSFASIQSTPRGAEVWLSEQPRGVTPLTVELPPGEYLLRLDLDGFEPYSETIRMEPGVTAMVRVALVPRGAASHEETPTLGSLTPDSEDPIEPQEPTATGGSEASEDLSAMAVEAIDDEEGTPPVEPPREDDSGGIRATSWLVGIFGATGTVAIILAVIAGVKANDQYDLAQTADVLRDDSRFNQAIEDGTAARDASNLLYLVGIAAVTTAVVLYFALPDADGSDREDDEPSASGDSRLRFSVGPQGIGVVW